MRKNQYIFGLLLSVVACGGDDSKGGDFTITDQIITGVADGEAWTFDNGGVEVTADNLLDFDFRDGELDDGEERCNHFANFEGTKVFFSVPAEVGKYPLSFSFDENAQTATFYKKETNLNTIAADGLIRIDEITDTHVSGGLHIEAGDDYKIDGTFDIERCDAE